MKEIPERPLTELEYVIISKLLEHPFPGSEEIKQQTKSPTVISAADDDNYGSIYFKAEGSNRAVTLNNLPVEGTTHDTDGVVVDILLHVINGFLHELEIIKVDGTNLLASIQPEKIEVIINDKPIPKNIPEY